MSLWLWWSLPKPFELCTASNPVWSPTLLASVARESTLFPFILQFSLAFLQVNVQDYHNSYWKFVKSNTNFVADRNSWPLIQQYIHIAAGGWPLFMLPLKDLEVEKWCFENWAKRVFDNRLVIMLKKKWEFAAGRILLHPKGHFTHRKASSSSILFLKGF